MMLAKPKPDDGGREETSSPPPLINTIEETTTTTDEDREKELERRLAMLGGVVTGNDDEQKEEKEEAVVEQQQQIEEDATDNLMSFDPIPIKTPAPPAPAPAPVVESKPKPAAVKPNKSALLARIMAAQERAKQAQMKQSSTAPTPPVQFQTATKLPAPSELTINPEQEKEKMMKALSGVVDVEIEKETNADDDLKPPPLPPPPQFTAPPMMAPPISTMSPPPFTAPPTQAAMPPPPSFDIFEQMQMKEEKNTPPPPMPPPAFDAIESDILGPPEVQAPSAPPEESLLDNFDGITPMAPPPTYPGEQVEVDDAGMFEFDIDGNPLSPEERRKMMEEQRAIMEQIKKQSIENKASEAAVRANAFETRMMANQTGGFSAPSTLREPSGVTTSVESIDFGNIDPAEVEEQRKILEAIQKKSQKDSKKDYQSPSMGAAEGANRTVEIGNGKKVALHGQEKTKEAIKDGSAILVQCVNCDNWMQVTGAASLMFCPICSVVSPVIQKDSVLANEEAKQMEEDRKLAELLQNEENAAASNYPGNRRAASSAAAPEAGSSWWDSQEGSSWWDSLKVSMGVSTEPEDSQNKRSAEIQISRPPGSMSSSQRALHGASTGDSYDNEREGLIGGGSGSDNPRAARVAESKPLFSCVVDSVSNAAAVAAAGVTSMTQGDEEEVHGVDTTSFLAVPKIGDDRGSSGNYSAIPNDD